MTGEMTGKRRSNLKTEKAVIAQNGGLGSNKSPNLFLRLV